MRTLTRPAKVEQAAALMRLVFEQNPGVRMTRRDIEECLDLEGFSPSTRQRALWFLVSEGVIESTCTYLPEGPVPNVYWKSEAR